MLLDYKLASEYRKVSLRPEHIRASGQTREDVAKLLDVLWNPSPSPCTSAVPSAHSHQIQTTTWFLISRFRVKPMPS